MNPLEKTDKTPLDLAQTTKNDVVTFLKSCGALSGEELRRIEGEKYSMHKAVKDSDIDRIRTLANESSVNVRPF